MISGSILAMHLAQVALEDDAAHEIINEHNFEVSLSTKFQLTIKCVDNSEK